MATADRYLQTCRFTKLQTNPNPTHRPQTPCFKHPVSGVIATCNLLHKQTTKAMVDRAKHYGVHFNDLRDKMGYQLPVRIEGVLRFEAEHIPDTVVAGDMYHLDSLMSLLEDEAMLLPFKEEDNGGLRSVTSAVIQKLTLDLENIFREGNHKGGYDNAWKTFQIELALEEFFHGQPRSPQDRGYSMSLGTSSVHIESLTRQRGFLGLSSWASASAGMVPPPISNWTSVPTQQARVRRIYPLTDSLKSNDAVLGREMAMILLKDIYDRNYDLPLEKLQGKEEEKIKPKDSLDYEELASKVLEHKGYFRYPCVFPRAVELIEESGKDPMKCLLAGLQCLGLKFFPSIRYRTFKGTKKVNWNFTTFVEVRQVGEPISEETKMVKLSETIAQEVLDRGLTEEGHVERYRKWGMPWLPMVIKRFPPEVTNEEKKMRLLVYLSCIAMNGNGSFIDYVKLKELHRIQPISIKRMLELRLRSVFTFKTICRDTVLYKLADDIPTTVAEKRKLAAVREEVAEAPEAPEETDVQQVDDIDTPQARSASLALPAGTKKRWEPVELALIPTGGTMQDDYKDYLKACKERSIPYRSKEAFRKQRRIMMQN